MNLVGSVVVAAVVGVVLWRAKSLGGSNAGLTLSYATQFTSSLMWLFRVSTQVRLIPQWFNVDASWVKLRPSLRSWRCL
jgi:hypothetical protein